MRFQETRECGNGRKVRDAGIRQYRGTVNTVLAQASKASVVSVADRKNTRDAMAEASRRVVSTPNVGDIYKGEKNGDYG